MKKAVKQFSSLLGVFIICLFMGATTVSAASSDVGIEPAYPDKDNDRTQGIFIMSLKPGETGKNGIHLINSGKEAHTVSIYATDSSYSVDGSFSCRQHAEAVKEVGTWVKLDKEKLTINPGESIVVDFTVTSPKGTEPGEHDGCIAVQDQANLPAKSGSGVLLGVRSAIRLAVTTPGKIIKKLSIDRIEVKRVAGGDYSVSPIAHNGGNVSLDVTARAQLVSVFGQRSELKSDASYPVMQGATTGWAYVFKRPYWGGVYKAQTSLSYNANPSIGLGQGKNDQRRISRTSSWFIAIPDPLAGAAELVACLAVLWLIITPLRRRLRRKHIIKHWEKHIVQDVETIMSIAADRGAKWRVIAKHNHLKAPYMVEAGRAIIVPKKKVEKVAKKTKKARRSELDWFSDEAVLVSEESKIAEKNVVSKDVDRDVEVLPSRTAVPEPRHRQQPPVDWVSPRESSYVDMDEGDYDEDFVDWREGADEREVSRIEHRLEGVGLTPKLRKQIPTIPKKASKKPATKKANKKRS